MDDERALGIAATAGVVVLLETGGTLVLWLVNGEGPFDQQRWPGVLLGLGGGVVAGLLVLALVRGVARRSTYAVAGLLVVLAGLAWVLLPRQVDVSESFLPRENPRWSCTGWSFRHYPVATTDASSTRWCVGLEHRISDG